MTQEELNDVLCKHNLWLEGKEGGECADMRGADMRGADMHGANMLDANMQGANMQHVDMQGANMQHVDMRGANMRGTNMQQVDMRVADMQGADMRGTNMQQVDMRVANMQHVDMQGANMQHVDMRGANMQGANIDYSAWPLWCGSLKAHVDDRIAIQLLYHTLSVVQYSPYVSEELKRTLLTEPVVDIANRFHRVRQCGALTVYEGESHDEQ